jgi:hypothetical protein
MSGEIDLAERCGGQSPCWKIIKQAESKSIKEIIL